MPRKRKKSKQAAPSTAPCLNDPRWLALTALHRRLSEHAASDDLAAADLNEALAGKPVMRCMRRDMVSGVRERVPAAFWAGHELYEEFGRWVVGPRNSPRALASPLTDHFYVWEPDAAKRWPALQRADDTEVAEMPERRKPGPKITKDWKLHVAGELHRIVIIEHKPPPPASYFAKFCGEKLEHTPDIRAVQKLVKALLHG